MFKANALPVIQQANYTKLTF